MKELRFYTFINFYLSSIQQGVQSFHVLHEMFNKYHALPLNISLRSDQKLAESNRLHDWSTNHKTVILLNGGANEDIESTYYKLEELSRSLSFPMPFEKFNEDSKSLGGIITACGCVLPQEIYEAVDYRKASNLLGWERTHRGASEENFFYISDNSSLISYGKGSPEHDLITLLKSCSLAR